MGYKTKLSDDESSFSSPFDRIRNHPGILAYDRWSNLSASYSGIFGANKEHLLYFLKLPNTDKKLMEELMHNMWESGVRDSYFTEMLRLLHNYTASAMSLVDHSRRFIEKYKKYDFASDYEFKRESVSGSNEHKFLQGLRNYMSHVGIPPVGCTITVKAKEGETIIPNLTVSELLKWDNWSLPAKNYIENSDTDIALIELIETHGRMIDELYRWIFDQFDKLHGAEIDELNELISATIPKVIKNERKRNKWFN